TPYSFWLSGGEHGLFISGVELQATQFLNLLRGDWLRRWSVLTEALMIIGFGLLFGVGLVRFHPVWASAGAAAAMLFVPVLFYVLFRQRLVWFPWLMIEVQ